MADHGSCRCNTAQALTRWQHPVASSEAQDVLHWVMHPALHHRIRMTIKTARNFLELFAIVNHLLAHNRS